MNIVGHGFKSYKRDKSWLNTDYPIVEQLLITLWLMSQYLLPDLDCLPEVSRLKLRVELQWFAIVFNHRTTETQQNVDDRLS